MLELMAGEIAEISTFLNILRAICSGHGYPARRDIDGGPRRFTEVVLNEQWINGFSTNIMHAIIWPSAV